MSNKRILYKVYEGEQPDKIVYQQEFTDKIILFWQDGLEESVKQWQEKTKDLDKPILYIEFGFGEDNQSPSATFRVLVRDSELARKIEQFNVLVMEISGDKEAIKEAKKLVRCSK